MVEHTQTNHRQITDELFVCVWPFCEIGAKKVNTDQVLLHWVTFKLTEGIFQVNNKDITCST